MQITNAYGGLSGRDAASNVFYDIGSGAGKPVFAAAMLCRWSKCVGIELLPGLHEVSKRALERWRDPDVATRCQLPEHARSATIDFVLADATKYNWSDATLWHANSTCFDEPMLKRLAEQADNCKPGTFAITITKKIPSHQWRVLDSCLTKVISLSICGSSCTLHSTNSQMSWGDATVIISQRI